jgi:hypothetical protein
MKIRMKTTAPGSIDGIRVTSYEADTEYDLTATTGERDLAAAFVGAGFAVGLDAKPTLEGAPDLEPDPSAQESDEPAPKPGRQKKQ